MFVDKTADGGETKAVELTKDVQQRCPHGAPAGRQTASQRLKECGRRLERVDELIGLAEEGLASIERQQNAEAVLDAIADQVALQVATAIETVESMLVEQEEALAAAISAGQTAATEEEIEHVLADVSGEVTTVIEVVSQIRRGGPDLNVITDRALSARTALSRLEERLAAI
jgi:hypothetical protein